MVLNRLRTQEFDVEQLDATFERVLVRLEHQRQVPGGGKQRRAADDVVTRERG